MSGKSELRDHVRRIVGEDPTISTINLQKRIAQELAQRIPQVQVVFHQQEVHRATSLRRVHYPAPS